jgi:hypothetical protein
MHVVSGKTSQKFLKIVDCHGINETLHGAKQVMVKLKHVNSLVKHKVIYMPVSRKVKCKGAADCLKRLQTLLWVIPDNLHRSDVTLYN